MRIAHAGPGVSLALILGLGAPAQGTGVDYARAAGVRRAGGLVARFVLDSRWLPDGGGIVWRESTDGEERLVLVDAATGERRTAETAAELGVEWEPRRAEPRRASARSRNGGAETMITLRNGLDQELRVRWIDASGRAHDYGSLEESLDAVDGLLEALLDEEPEVRAAAVWSLDEINPSR